MLRSIALILVLLVIGAPQAQSQGDDPAYDGLDILFIVDQSGSMGGEPYDGPARQPTDPLGLRFESVQFALGMLGDYRLRLAPDAEMNAAVIYFGDDAVTHIDWTPIATSGDEWRVTGPILQEQAGDDYFRDTYPRLNRGNTNFLAAFEQAEQMFQNLQNADGHLHVIILLTDGAPCVVEGPNAFQCGDPVGEQAHMEQLVTMTQQAFPDAANFRVHVLALDAEQRYWPQRRGDWERVAGANGTARRVDNNQQIGVQFFEILRELLAQTITTPNGGGADPVTGIELDPTGSNVVEVPPYLKAMRVTVFKSSSEPARLNVTVPGGTLMPNNDPRLSRTGVDSAIETWTIENPDPGPWTFAFNTQQTQLNVFLDFIALDVQATTSGGPYTQLDTVPITIRMLDGDGQPLPEYPPPYDLRVEGHLTAPDGSTSTVILSAAGQGTYEASVRTTITGSYRIGVRAVTRFPPGQDYVVYEEDNVGAFLVNSFALVLETTPEPQYLVGQSLEVVVSLQDASGQAVILPGLVVNASLVSVDDDAVVIPFDLSAGGNGTLIANPVLTTPGTYQVVIDATLQDGVDVVPVESTITSSSFEVLPSQMISLHLISPEANTTQKTTTGFPPLEPTEAEIHFEARIQGEDNPVALEDIVLDPANIWRIESNVSGLAVEPDGEEPGRYKIVLGELEAGDYRFAIYVQDNQLSGRYVLDPNNASIRVAIKREVSTWYYLFWVGLVAAIVVPVVGSTGWILYRRRKIRRHPITGKLVIMRSTDGSPQTIWRLELSHFRRNTIRLGRRKLPRETGLSKLVLQSTSSRMSESGAVRVTAIVKGKRVLNNVDLYPGSMQPLKQDANMMSALGMLSDEPTTMYYLQKDPIEYDDDSFSFNF